MAALALVLLALAAAVVAKPLEPCPSSCRCFLSEGLKRADCRSVPEWADKQSDAQDVRILPPAAGRGARSSALHLTHFEVFPRVLQLAVTNRSIVEVIPSGFHGLRSLQELDLSHNLLSRFSYKVFARMPALRRLVLAGNPIVLDRGVPLLTSRSLLSLDLSHCEIVDVPKGSLDGLRNLTSLSLRGNPLQLQKGRPLLTLRGGGAITELDLSACELDAIPDGVLDGLPGLRRLYLDGNNLVVVDKGVLPRGLHHLDLSGNQIRNAPTAVISSLRNLTKLELSENPITCTCSLIGLQGWLSRQLVVTERPVVCAAPPEYRGKSWTKVDELELCREEEKDESSSSDDDDGGGSSSSTSQDEPLPDDLYDDDSLELPPAYEQYTHENVIGGSGLPAGAPSALPLKVLKADEPYDPTTSRSGEAGEAAATSAAPDATAEAATEAPVDRASESESEDDGDDEGVDSELVGDSSDDIDQDEHNKDAETLFRNDETIAMGKSMQEKTDPADNKEAGVVAEVPPTEAAAGESGAAAAAEATAHPDSEPEQPEEQPGVAPETPAEPVTEAVPETTSAPEAPSAAEHTEAPVTAEEHQGEHVQEEAAAVSPAASLVGEEDSTDGPATTTISAEETTVPATLGDRSGMGRSLVGGVEIPKAGDGEEAPAEHPTELPEGDHLGAAPTEADSGAAKADEGAGEAAGAVVVPATEEHTPEVPDEAVPTTAAPQPAVEEAIVPVVAKNVVGTENDDAPAAVPPTPESPLPEVPVVAEVPEGDQSGGAEASEPPAAVADVVPSPEAAPSPGAGTDAAAEPVPVEEAVPASKAAPELSEVPVAAVPAAPEVPAAAVPAAPEEVPAEAATPSSAAPSEAVDGVAVDDKKHESIVVGPVPPSQRDGDEDADLQKSTITYVILGCVVLAMVVLVVYALLRKRAKTDEESGDDRNHQGGPEVEMKNMMNPLLGNGSAHPEHQGHGRRASLESLELIREEDESTRLQPSDDHVDLGTPAGAKGAAEAAKTPETTRAKAPARANGKPAAAAAPNGKANGRHGAEPTSPTAAPTEATTPGQQRPPPEQPSKVTVKAGVISAPVPSTPVLVNRANGVNRVNGGLNGVNGKVNGVGKNA
ncbi:hypothetical protein ONE63_008598 [Megalurothrips usitatus]|uniref:LRRCT domain-containing protein n=1 Tax=Megalurothrips usitatus TaxID=439358 RepID=A0AAV7XQ88_9NEOP|nr:hypothetical protein ONE63_008598 [Megalurothrips usitatus]